MKQPAALRAEFRKLRVRSRIRGTSERPRLCVTPTLRHIHAQVIDDQSGRTLVSVSTLDRDIRQKLPQQWGGDCAAASQVGTVLATRAIQAGIQQVVFDRGSHPYHGRLKALAQADRQAGLRI